MDTMNKGSIKRYDPATGKWRACSRDTRAEVARLKDHKYPFVMFVDLEVNHGRKRDR